MELVGREEKPRPKNQISDFQTWVLIRIPGGSFKDPDG